MTDINSIIPSPELIEQWRREPQYVTAEQAGRYLQMVSMSYDRFVELMEKSARYGADQQLKLDAEQINQAWQKGADHELEACCEWLEDADLDDSQKVSWVNLRAVRRPKPPSLKEQALKALKNIDDACESEGFSRSDDTDIIRRALEQLND